jgi:serine/threonine-protein kinase
MELVDGPALTREMARGPLPPARALDIIAQVAGGLAAAHAAGVVHRDIKPGNLLVDPAGQVKITDFGIAYAAGSAPLTRTGTLLGTPAYLAPERISGAEAGPASDLYSLGMVAYECLTGALPFTGTAVEIALAHQIQALPPLTPAVPAEVAALVADLTARDPAARPGSAAEVAERAAALRVALDGARTSPAVRGAAAYPGPAASQDSPGTTADGHAATAYLDLPGRDGTGPYQGAGPGGRYAPARRRPRYLAAVIAVVVIGCVAGWLLASAVGPAPGPAARPPPSQAASRTVAVHAGALVGLPVRIAVARLRQLGLRVRLAWQPSDQPRGTVLAVRPGGKVLRGTVVVVTAAARPPGHDQGHGRGHGDGGNGQGGD